MNLEAIVLAGGESRRMQQRKELLLINGKPIIQMITEQLAVLTDRISIITNEPELYPFLAPSITIKPDIFPSLGPIAGLHAGMSDQEPDTVYIVAACDYPLLTALPFIEMLALLGSHPTKDAVVPIIDGRSHPLFAVFHGRTLGKWAAALYSRNLKVMDVLPQLSIIHYLPNNPAIAEQFINMNTPEDYQAIILKKQLSP
ncbi:hypothetical protein BBD42_22665 [Paenibacillus sp. BIHB 4019]|uniref:Probable molybdenum cofactor guanylyltransferase n=1 Tax=Paenibacillus sp. BIHB 4019 TaxID=1870819 RepID=A0A1B2DMN9_9BACL|nr:molybdenum cofactor guanylyltransferase [Paenibacillus sp. BIHB 4019]ANY68975.1 hypothetical protein BBD42_22665 [Paenibacillus sp. BIHB 4019]